MPIQRFDPVPACFNGVEFLPIPRVERIVRARLNRFESETGRKAEFPIDIEALVEIGIAGSASPKS